MWCVIDMRNMEYEKAYCKYVLHDAKKSWNEYLILYFFVCKKNSYFIFRISCFSHVLMISWENWKFSLEFLNFSLSHEVLKWFQIKSWRILLWKMKWLLHILSFMFLSCFEPFFRTLSILSFHPSFNWNVRGFIFYRKLI